MSVNQITSKDIRCNSFFLFRLLQLPQIDEQSDLFDSLPWSTDTRTLSLDATSSNINGSQTTSTGKTTTELPSLLTLLLPMMNGIDSNSTTPTPTPQAPSQTKPPAIIFSSNNGVIDDPLIQSLAAEQAASAHNYDLLSHRNKRVKNDEKEKNLVVFFSTFSFVLGSTSITLW